MAFHAVRLQLRFRRVHRPLALKLFREADLVPPRAYLVLDRVVVGSFAHRLGHLHRFKFVFPFVSSLTLQDLSDQLRELPTRA